MVVRRGFNRVIGRTAGPLPDGGRRTGGSSRPDWPVAVGVIFGAAAVLAATVMLIMLVLRTPERPAPLNGTAAPAESGVLGTAGPAGTGAPGVESNPQAARAPAGLPAQPPSGAGSGSASAAQQPSAPPLTASYAVADPSLVGYRVTVTIANPNPTPVERWTVSITLPRPTLTVSDVVGAESRQVGGTWIFVPDASTRLTPAGKSVSFGFQVDGLGLNSAPTACTIDGYPCASTSDGLPR
jgi:hypothetical protein